ncbi:MAG: dihydroorotate dehydrogenase electron transfer subunit [Proteobacteria bacterium]|jgi:dihydroorotate dehydrogenase electron transfer subunit|nr:dihydroorotate dehydrogenase electron transfer subunit [Pseudomonadota bacterium]
MDYLKTEIVENVEVATGTALLRFRGERPVAGRPGQFVMVRGAWGAHPVLGRAFSLVEVGAVGAVLVRAVGDGTRRLCALAPGDRLSVLGPLGHGFLGPAPDRTPVLVAGGVGVAPIAFLAESLAAAGTSPIIFYGARTAGDLPLADRLAAAGELTLATEDGSRGERGFVTSALERLLASRRDAQIYACGPEPMLEAVARLAVACGAPCQVALESPMACGMGTCKGCAVLAARGDYKYVCSDGPVFESAEIFGEGGAR